jgi:hypothetical protein
MEASESGDVREPDPINEPEIAIEPWYESESASLREPKYTNEPKPLREPYTGSESKKS